MNVKKWLKIWLYSMIISILSIVGFNYLIDPLWFFSHSHKLNTLQVGMNERLQKSIKLKYNKDLKNIDTLLMGSSRSTYYDENKFSNLKVFNFSFSNAYPDDYQSFINYAKALKGKEFKNIILGLDFFGSGTNKTKQEKIDYLSNFDKNSSYIFSNYMSIDTLQYSFTNMIRSMTNSTGRRSYNRSNIVIVNKEDSEKVIKRAKKRSKTYWEKKKMEYNENYINILKDLKYQNQKSNFIVYTTPLSNPFLNIIYHNKELKEYYFKWIKDMVFVFDKIYFFTLKSELSKNYKNYSLDGDHYYPEAVENISKIISGEKSIKGFGFLITKDNINEFLVNLKEQIQNNDVNETILDR